VGYGEWAEVIDSFNDGEVSVDVSSNPITSDFDKIDTMQLRHQAGEFNGQTAMGDGILKGRHLLVGTGGDDDGFSRYGARPTMILMTDGQTNELPAGWSLPSGFNWAHWTDYDGDGAANYSTTNNYKRYAFWEATEAVKRGITIHTIAVGAEADRQLMAAIAFAGGGVFIDVPVHSSVEEIEEQLSAAFSQIAAKVPPAQLLYDD
jgi:Mg-chelatase subunit ChlD